SSTSYFARLSGVRSFEGASVTSTSCPALVRSSFRKGVVSFHLCPWSPVTISTLTPSAWAVGSPVIRRSPAAAASSNVRMGCFLREPWVRRQADDCITSATKEVRDSREDCQASRCDQLADLGPPHLAVPLWTVPGWTTRALIRTPPATTRSGRHAQGRLTWL